MRKLSNIIVICLIVCLSMEMYYASDNQRITEAQFATLLGNIQKVGSQVQTGTNTALTREKAACMIVDFLGYSAIVRNSSTNTSSFTDVTTSKAEIELVNQLGIMSGVGSGKFQPNGYVSTASAQAIIQKIKSKLSSKVQWKHACYAISSSSQMDWIKDFDAVSFGWAEVISNGNGFKVSLSGGDFSVPSGFSKPVDAIRYAGGDAYLMFYFDGGKGKAQTLLNSSANRAALIKEIVKLSTGVTKDGAMRSFDGVTIDFEGFIDSSLKEPYVNFLKELKAELNKKNKKLCVAIQPTLYFKGYDYKGIGNVADYIILMAHDYGSTSLSLYEQQTGVVTTPLTPIYNVYSALLEAKKSMDPSKVALQFSFGSIQWQKQNGAVLNSRAYTPSMDKILARLQMPGTEVKFNTYYQSTYATYINNNILNVIWYEDAKSIKTKMDLAKLLGINQFSYWRLGMLPNEIRNLS